jgi:hypothetical protein
VRHPGGSVPPRQLLAYGFEHSNLFASGSMYLYSNSNTVLLGLVVEKPTHTPLPEYLWMSEDERDQHLGRPLVLRVGTGNPPSNAASTSQYTLTAIPVPIIARRMPE